MALPSRALTAAPPRTPRALARLGRNTIGSWIVIALGVVALVSVLIPTRTSRRLLVAPYVQAVGANTTAKQIAFAPDGLPRTTVSSADGQFVLNLGNGSIVLDPAEHAAAVRIVAIDPTELGRVPRGLRPDGNAYRVALAYEPSGRAVDTVGAAGTFFLTVPEQPAGLLYSDDGRTWRRVTSQTGPQPSIVVSPAVDSGYYLGVATRPRQRLIDRLRPPVLLVLGPLLWVVFLRHLQARYTLPAVKELL